MPKNKEAADYAKHKADASLNYSKAMKTGNTRALKRAKRDYAYCDYLELQAKHPGTKVNVNNTTVNDSFKSSKQKTNGVHQLSTSVKVNKKVDKRKLGQPPRKGK